MTANTSIVGDKPAIPSGSLRYVLIATTSVLMLFLLKHYQYLLFHAVVEIICVIIACCIGFLSWNSRKIITNNFLLILGTGYLFVSIIDLTHMLAYSGMNIFTGITANHPTQLWIAARYFESLLFFGAPFFLRRNVNTGMFMWICLLLTLFILLSIFVWGIFPNCYVDGEGLTDFKIINEWIIALIFILAIFSIVKKREFFDRNVLLWIVCALIAKAAAELCFTFYTHVYGMSNFIGHLLKVLSYGIIYKAFVVTGFSKPFNLMFLELETSKKTLEKTVREQTKLLADETTFLNTVLEHIQDGIVACNADGTLTLFNRATRQFHGLPEEPLPAREWARHYDLYRTDGTTLMAQEDIPLFKAFSGEKISSMEMVISPKKGKKRTLLASGQPLYDEAGEKLGAVVSMHDITEQKQAEIFLKNAHDALEKKVTERVKELTCLQKISRLFEEKGRNVDSICQSAVNLIPPAWQYPKETCARLTLNGKEYLSEKFSVSEFRMARDIIVYNKKRGLIEVFYTKKMPESDEGPFLKEERSLINTVAESLGKTVECIRAEQKKEKLISKLQLALTEVKTLRGILPICSFCKKIRTDDGYWEQVETYICERSDADFSHGVCDQCMKKHYAELFEENSEEDK